MATLDKDVKILTISDQDRKDVLLKAKSLGYTLITGYTLNEETIKHLCALNFTNICLRTDKDPMYKNMMFGSYIQLGYEMCDYQRAILIEEMTLNDFLNIKS